VIENMLILYRILRMARLGRQALDRFDPKFARGPRSICLDLSMEDFHPYNTDSSPYSCWPFPDALQSASQQISERRVYIPCSCDSWS
jgi:hypothetical protein